jgi:hypothetical protein
MILFVEQKNQLCNRIFSLIPAIAWSLENNEKLVVLFFSKQYLKLFPNLASAENIRFGLSVKGIFPDGASWILYHLVNFISKIFTFRRKNFSFHNISKNKKRILFVNGWKERNAPSYISENFEIIKMLFQPDELVRNKVDIRLEKEKRILIGVHIRRKDYRTFYGGAYFFDFSVYRDIMQQLSNLLVQDGKETCFIVCSDEPVPDSFAQGLTVIAMNSPDAISDLYALSKCDYIIGPPSTFSQWASFFGEVPIRVITSENEKIRLDDFRKAVSIDRFQEM